MGNCIYENICDSYGNKCNDCSNNDNIKMDFFKSKKICPVCGAELTKDTSVILVCYPAQFKYECDNCHYVGYYGD